MKIDVKIREDLAEEWLPAVYSDRIRTQRTRSINLDIRERENQAEIQYTLLGIELKVGKRRFACPDLATARYLRVFARMGCREFAIPYDITKISAAADDLETSWQRTLLFVEEKTRGKRPKIITDARAKLVKSIRDSLRKIGPGDAMPKFDRETKQRKV
ncbi:MAG: hypothetical protein ACKVQJ_13705 [Pyrinomonadaceae bacterium]